MSSQPKRDWITLREAAELMGITYGRIRLLVDRQAISVVRLPGGAPMVSRSEVLKLVQRSIKPATVGA
jgi:excisionase family DNA binding protein